LGYIYQINKTFGKKLITNLISKIARHVETIKMLNFFKRRGGHSRDENASDIVTEVNINVSDEAPILTRGFDLGFSTSNPSSIHDLRRTNDEAGG
jgi:hypothetical protein